MSPLLVACALGSVRVEPDADDYRLVEEPVPPRVAPALGLPLLLDAAAAGERVVALVERRPPLLLSRDGGAGWEEAGGGLPPGVAVAISPADPRELAYATAERVYVSEDGGRFWRALSFELAGIERLAFDA